MSEAPAKRTPSPKRISVKCPAQTRSTPSPEAAETDKIVGELKISRKREREVSLEPATPTASNDADPVTRERKHSGLPVKKNRRVLATTEEEEDNGPGPGSGSRSASGSPPDAMQADSVLTSPRREMRRKVRQISQGVGDISWKGPTDPSISDKDVEIEAAGAPLADAAAHPHAEEMPSGKTEAYDVCREIDEEETPPKTPEELAHSGTLPDVKLPDSDTAMLTSPRRRQRTGGATRDAVHLQAPLEANEKGLKRKFLDRGTSQGPSENGDAEKHPSEPLKRPRDDADEDDNPRETKKPSPPPPSPPRQPSPTKAPKLGGFMAYASTSSPFASVKGQNIFSPSSKIPAAFPGSSKSLTDLASTTTTATSTSTTTTRTPTTTPAPKRSGFEAFASSASPFASAAARAKSPALGSAFKLGRAKSPAPRSHGASAFAGSAFASYAGPSQGFFGLTPNNKCQRAADSPNGSGLNSPERMATPVVVNVFGACAGGTPQSSSDDDEAEDGVQTQSFGERLRAAESGGALENDEEEEKLKLTEQDVATGEEEEETIHQVRGKLFSLHGSSWKERGTGVMRLNVNRDDGTGARLVMRKDAVFTLLLNVTLFPGMRCTLAQDPRYLRFSAIENGATTTYNLRLPDTKVAQDLLEEINANIPSPTP